MAKLICRRGHNEGEEFALREGGNLVGRDDSCQASLFGWQCSRQHCLIRKTGAHYTVEDLDSTNGTFLNGRRIEGPTAMAEGDVLTVGGSVLALSFQPVGRSAARLCRDVTRQLETTEFSVLIDQVSSRADGRHYQHTQRLPRGTWRRLGRFFSHLLGREPGLDAPPAPVAPHPDV